MKKLLYLTLLVACSHQPMTYYHFEATEESPQKTLNRININFDSIRIARYLSGQQIPYQSTKNQIDYFHNHAWISPLPNEIGSYLSYKLNTIQPHFLFLAPFEQQENAPTLILSIDEFKGVAPNQVVIIGKWQLLRKGRIMAIQPLNYQLTQSTTGVTAMIALLQQGLDLIAKNIISRLDTMNLH